MNKDTIIRTVKTFVQAFAGNFAYALAQGFANAPAQWSAVIPWLFNEVLTPQVIFGSCFATAICAVWNTALQKK